MEEFIDVFFDDKTIKVPKDFRFKELRVKVLQTENRLIKFFVFEGVKINENLSIKNFPTFKISMDRNIFCEFKKGQYRCKRCRKYVRLTTLTCHHSNICKTFYNFKKQESMNRIIDGGYFEKDDKNYRQKSPIKDEEDNYSDDDKKIKEILDKHEEKYKKKMLDKINEILLKKDK